MKSLLLFLIAVILTAIATPFAVFFVIFEPLSKLLGDIALSIDMAGNVLLASPMNRLLITENGYKFGNRKETISSALGKNKRDNNLTESGKFIANILDFIDDNHCLKSIDNVV